MNNTTPTFKEFSRSQLIEWLRSNYKDQIAEDKANSASSALRAEIDKLGILIDVSRNSEQRFSIVYGHGGHLPGVRLGNWDEIRDGMVWSLAFECLGYEF